MLDNECNRVAQQCIKSKQVNVQLVKPHSPHVNTDETAIKTSKYHIIDGLQTVDPDFPLKVWAKFIPQMQDRLNLLRTPRHGPEMPEFKDIDGPFDYNKTPVAILDTKGLAFIDPKEPKYDKHTESMHL